jgi:hypothetical protein
MFFNTPNNFNQNQTMPTPTNNGWNGNGSFGMNNNTVGAPNGGFNNQFSNPMAPGPLVQNQ